MSRRLPPAAVSLGVAVLGRAGLGFDFGLVAPTTGAWFSCESGAAPSPTWFTTQRPMI